jgi:ATP-dependent RNA helicase RhlE
VREQIAGFEPVELDIPPGDPHGGVKGHRKSKKDKLREAAARAASGAPAGPKRNS